jgi:hypothetical protein
MAKAFHNAIAGAMRAANDAAGEAVVYRRGGTDGSLEAIYSARTYKAADEYGELQSVQVDDWLIVAEDLVIGGIALKPQRGDTIRRPYGVSVQVYEVQGLPGQHVWQWSGPTRYRVHTKLIGTEAA